MAEQGAPPDEGAAEMHSLPQLSSIEKGNWGENLHPRLSIIDDIIQEVKYHWKLVRETWSMLHVRALVVGGLAFIVGSISTEIIGGGDPFISGIEGIRTIDGISFFQLILSLALWVWFIMQIWNLFPIMKGHAMNLISAWLAGTISMILFHATAPNFPMGFVIGDMLGGIVGIFVMIFLSFIVGRAVIETRDDHVKIRHASDDQRKIDHSMSEHSLGAWGFSLGLWMFVIVINSWSGAHFVADRHAEKYFFLILHILTGPIAIAGLLHLLWFPQIMLGVGEETRVLSSRARMSRTNPDKSAPVSTKTGEVKTSNTEGKCPECKKPSPIFRHVDGEAHAPCPKDGCEGSGAPNSQCELCKTTISSRWTCSSCGVNAPLVDYLPDGDAW